MIEAGDWKQRAGEHHKKRAGAGSNRHVRNRVLRVWGQPPGRTPRGGLSSEKQGKKLRSNHQKRAQQTMLEVTARGSPSQAKGHVSSVPARVRVELASVTKMGQRKNLGLRWGCSGGPPSGSPREQACWGL